MNKVVKGLAALAVIGGLAYVGKMVFFSQEKQLIEYRTMALEKDEVVLSISSNGTLEPSDAIDVGAQVSAMIMSFGTDTEGHIIDFGSEVRAGMVLANLDDEVYQAEFTKAKANQLQAESQKLQAEIEVQEAKANVQAAEVTLSLRKAELVEREANAGKLANEWRRIQRLGKEYASEQTYDQTEWDYKIALAAAESAKKIVEQAVVALEQANIKHEISKTRVTQAEATIEQANAQIVSARRNLEYCVIKAPVDGVIIDRRVNVGQTVSAGLSAPSLFLLAKDLTKMQVWVSVNEADIGVIKKDMPVTFTVDAFPDKVFKGKVKRIRLNASMTSNVVLYIVEVDTDNSDGVLLPYLTAEVNFEIERKDDIFAVPNVALRYQPLHHEEDVTGRQIIWVRDEKGNPQAIDVELGVSDGIKTEVISEKLTEGMEVILSEEIVKEDEAKQDNVNPFMPGGRRRTPPKKTATIRK